MSPFAKINGLYFDPSNEPCDFYYKLTNDIEKTLENKDINYITFECDNEEDFYKLIKGLDKYTNDNISVSGTSREGHYDLVINEHSDMDDMTKPSTVALAKKKKEQTVIKMSEDK